MRDARVWKQLIGVDDRTVIEDVEFADDDETVVVHVGPRCPKHRRCGRCDQPAPGYDTGDGRRRWRGLDLGTLQRGGQPRARRREARLQMERRDRLRRLVQDHLDLRALGEARDDQVIDAASVTRGAVEAGHRRTLTTVFGELTVERLAYRRRGHAKLHPADGPCCRCG